MLPPRATNLRDSHEPPYGLPVCRYTLRGPHLSIHGLPACSVHATWSTPANSRITHVQPTRYGAHTSQVRSYPCGVGALRGLQQSSQGLPMWSVRYGVHTIQAKGYPRGAFATVYTSPSKDYSRKQTDTSIVLILRHTYRSNFFKLKFATIV